MACGTICSGWRITRARLEPLLLILLLATSNDFSLRRFGTHKWKQLQRWNYAVFALVAVHSFAFQGVETQKYSG